MSCSIHTYAKDTGKREGEDFEVSRILRASDISLTEGVLLGSFTPGFAGGMRLGI